MWKKIGFDPSELGDTTRDVFFWDPMDNSTETCMAQSHIKDLEKSTDLFWLDFFCKYLMMEKHETDIGGFFIVLLGGSSLDIPSMA